MLLRIARWKLQVCRCESGNDSIIPREAEDIVKIGQMAEVDTAAGFCQGGIMNSSIFIPCESIVEWSSGLFVVGG